MGEETKVDFVMQCDCKNEGLQNREGGNGIL